MTVSLAAVTFDCADVARVSGFWSAVLDRPLADGASADYATVTSTPAFAFFQVPEGKTVKNRVHVDLGTKDLHAEVDRILAIGATKLGDFDEFGFRWITLADPEGNEFDVVVEE